MDNVIAFTPRPRPAAPAVAPPLLAGLALRAHLEEAAQVALDAADKIIAALDRIEGAAGDGDDTADSGLIAMAAHAGQTFHLREPQEDPQAVPQVGVAAEPAPSSEPVPQDEPEPAFIAAQEIRLPPPPLPWNGYGNVVSAAGCAILALMARA